MGILENCTDGMCEECPRCIEANQPWFAGWNIVSSCRHDKPVYGHCVFVRKEGGNRWVS